MPDDTRRRIDVETIKSCISLFDALAKFALVVLGIVALTSPAVDRWLHTDTKLAGSITDISADQRMTLREYLFEARSQDRHNSIVDRPRFKPEQLAQIGRVIVFSAQYRGARSRRCAIRYTIADGATGAPVVAGDTLMSVIPETNDDTYVWDVFVPEPAPHRSVAVTIELLDDKNFPNGSRVALKTITLGGR